MEVGGAELGANTDMEAKTNSVAKKYETPFMLDSSKLSRILAVISDGVGISATESLRVRLANGTSIEVGDVEQLQTIDNAVKNGVKSLSIEASGDERTVTLVFGEAKGSGLITLNVSAVKVKDANEQFAALEEQVERTMMGGWAQKHLMTAVLVGLVAFLFGLAVLLPPLGNNPITKFENRDFLSSAETEQLRAMADSLKTIDEKVTFLVETRRRQLGNLNSLRVKRITTSWRSRYIYLRALPFLLVYSVLFYLGAKCYPKVVFKWGDMGEQYEHLVRRRRALWNLVIGGVLVGVLVGLSVEAWFRGGR